jgi:hypothetical protein
MFVMVGAMYVVMAVAVRFGPETLGVSLEDVSETVDTAPGSRPGEDAGRSRAERTSGSAVD